MNTIPGSRRDVTMVLVWTCPRLDDILTQSPSLMSSLFSSPGMNLEESPERFKLQGDGIPGHGAGKFF
ncbi:MAG: hypothetical protein R6V54_09710 [Desulfobacteraceae bacterium]